MLAEAVIVQSIVTRLGVGLCEVQIIVGGRDFIFSQSPHRLWGPHSIQGVPGSLMGEGLSGHDHTNLCGG